MKVELKLNTGQEHDPIVIGSPAGEVEHQDFWQGKPKKLIGFSKKMSYNLFDLDPQTFFDNPQLAIGKYVIFADSNDVWYIVPNAKVLEANFIEG